MTDNAKKFLEEASKNGALKADPALMSADELQAVAGGANYNPKLEGINAGQDKDGLMVDFCWDIAMR